MTTRALPLLVDLIDVFTLSEATEIQARTLESAATALEASAIGLVQEGTIIGSIGPSPLEEVLVDAAAAGPGGSRSDLAGVGALHTLCIPVPDGPRGSLVVIRPSRSFSTHEHTIARAMARMMSLATRNATVLQESHSSTSRQLADRLRDRHVSLVQRVLRLQQAVTLAAPEEQIVPLIVEQAGELFEHDRVGIRLIEDLGGRLWTANIEDHVAEELHQLGNQHGISGRAIQDNALVVEKEFWPIIHAEPRPTCAMAAPIYCHGEIVGAMSVVGGLDRHEPHDEEDQEALLIMAGYASVAITESTSTRRLQESLTEAEWRASHDDLTGLPNRARVIELVEEQLRTGRVPVALYIDLDGFKTVNDLYGHNEGDRALVALADRLSSAIRRDEVVARLAGDEFLVLLPPVSDDEALIVARRIAERLSIPLDMDGRQLALPPSIGIANIAASTAEELLDAADLAMYRAKRSHGERIVFFDDDLRHQRTRRVQIEQKLRLAVVEMRDFSLHFQPIVTSESDDMREFEALIRWTDPVLGPVGPDEFIPAAEETACITRIDTWVLRNALAEAASVDPQRRWRVSVNLSPASFLLPNLREIVEETLAETNSLPDALAIEITERVMLGDPAVAIRHIAELRELGVAILLDDFGTGYSSLSYLTDLDISGVKIDRAFVAGSEADPRSEAILRAVIGLAEDFRFEMIAEGVETTDQLDLLERLGCTRFQGYLFGRPAPIETYRHAAHLARPDG